MTKPLKIVRMNKQHLDAVFEVSQAAFTTPWTLDDFKDTLLQRDIVGLVALDGKTVAGYLIYERLKHVLFVVNMACTESHARQGVVTGLLNYVKTRLKEGRHERIETDVPENAKHCIGMLCKVGFSATGINRDQFESEGSVLDGYTFEYLLPRETWKNRIAHLLQPRE